jgi:hypothetical protein
MGVIGDFASYLEMDVSDTDDEADSCYLADIQPNILQAKMSVSDPDNPSYDKAMSSPEADQWWDAMVTKMETLENDLKAWKLVKITSDMKSILPSTWAFKVKRYPDRTVKKLGHVSVFVVTVRLKELTTGKLGCRLSSGARLER